jgi:hypothetical protein
VTLLAAALLAAPVPAHEIRPAMVTVTVEPDGTVELAITLNLEAVMAGIGPEDEETADSANVGQ